MHSLVEPENGHESDHQAAAAWWCTRRHSPLCGRYSLGGLWLGCSTTNVNGLSIFVCAELQQGVAQQGCCKPAHVGTCCLPVCRLLKAAPLDARDAEPGCCCRGATGRNTRSARVEDKQAVVAAEALIVAAQYAWDAIDVAIRALWFSQAVEL